MGYWKQKREREILREQDITRARAELATSLSEQREVAARAPIVAALAGYLAERRELNHFGDALSDSFIPRRPRHAR